MSKPLTQELEGQAVRRRYGQVGNGNRWHPCWRRRVRAEQNRIGWCVGSNIANSHRELDAAPLIRGDAACGLGRERAMVVGLHLTWLDIRAKM